MKKTEIYQKENRLDILCEGIRMVEGEEEWKWSIAGEWLAILEVDHVIRP